MPNIHNVLDDMWVQFGFNQTIAQQVSEGENHILQIYLQMSDRTLGLPTGTTVKRGALIELIGQTLSLVRNNLFTPERMTDIMNQLSDVGRITY